MRVCQPCQAWFGIDIRVQVDASYFFGLCCDMDKLERAQKLHSILQTRHGRPASLSLLCEELQTGERTVRRLIKDMRLYLDAPILNNPGQGYFYARNSTFELPGIWFTPEELQALLTIQQLTEHLSGGFLNEQVTLIQDKLSTLLNKNLLSPDHMQRIRVLGSGTRSKRIPMFSVIAAGLLERKRLNISYYGRKDNAWSERLVSPQHLVYYKGNWYLDAWCHEKKGLRTFAAENIQKATMLDDDCHELPQQVLEREFAQSFGIFSGEPKATAVLRFTEKAARWVADEQWFPDEEGRWLEDGTFELRIPYANPTELIMEICKYGADVKVIEPPELIAQVKARLEQAALQYR